MWCKYHTITKSETSTDIPDQIVDADVEKCGESFELGDARLAVAAFPMRDRHFGKTEPLRDVGLREVVFFA